MRQTIKDIAQSFSNGLKGQKYSHLYRKYYLVEKKHSNFFVNINQIDNKIFLYCWLETENNKLVTEKLFPF